MNLTLSLSRTCNLSYDFPDAISVAAWQQRLAEAAWQRWEAEHHIRTREQTLCVNYSGVPFTAPGPEPIYVYHSDPTLDAERALPAIFGLSVLDQHKAPVSFLQRAATILRPQGLLFLTFAFWDAEGEDCAEGADSRARIYDVHSWKKLIAEARRCGFQTFGGMDWRYHGNKLVDHTLASLVLTRR